MNFRKSEITTLLAFFKTWKKMLRRRIKYYEQLFIVCNKIFLLLFTLTIIEPTVQSTLLLTKAFRFRRNHLASYFYQNDLDINESFQYSANLGSCRLDLQ